jgi:hypothetical protein
MAFIEVHPLGSSKREIINIDQVQQIKDYGRFTRLHLADGRYQDVKDEYAEIAKILGG